MAISALTASLFSSGSSSNDTLSTLIQSRSQAATGASALAQFSRVQTTRGREIDVVRERPSVVRALDDFDKAVRNAKTVDDLLADPAAVSVLLKATGLSDQDPRSALVKKALTSDLTDSNSVANKLKTTNANFRSAADLLQFKATGLDTLRLSSTRQIIEDAYAEATWADDIDAQTPGVGYALRFLERAPKLTNPLSILGDPVGREVVTTALGLPKQIAIQDLPTQQRAITDRLDVSTLSDPKVAQRIAQRYLLALAQQGVDTSITA